MQFLASPSSTNTPEHPKLCVIRISTIVIHVIASFIVVFVMSSNSVVPSIGIVTNILVITIVGLRLSTLLRPQTPGHSLR